jgi:hypothetical protein
MGEAKTDPMPTADVDIIENLITNLAQPDYFVT